MDINIAEMKVCPTFDVIAGPMFSGKSQEINRRLTNIDYYNKHQEENGQLKNVINYIILRPDTDTRDVKVRQLPYADKYWRFVKRDNLEVDKDNEFHSLDYYDLVVLDEAQFFAPEVINQLKKLLKAGKSLIVSGLEKDYRGEPFSELMSWSLCVCDDVQKLTAICSVCGRPSTTAKMIALNGVEIPEDSNILIEDENHKYVPTCRKHFNWRY